MKKLFSKSNMFHFLLLMGFCLMSNAALADDSPFEPVIQTLLNLFYNIKQFVYVLGAFGLIAISIGAIFGHVNWKWYSGLGLGLVVVSISGSIIDYVTGSQPSSYGTWKNALDDPSSEPRMPSDGAGTSSGGDYTISDNSESSSSSSDLSQRGKSDIQQAMKDRDEACQQRGVTSCAEATKKVAEMAKEAGLSDDQLNDLREEVYQDPSAVAQDYFDSHQDEFAKNCLNANSTQNGSIQKFGFQQQCTYGHCTVGNNADGLSYKEACDTAIKNNINNIMPADKADEYADTVADAEQQKQDLAQQKEDLAKEKEKQEEIRKEECKWYKGDAHETAACQAAHAALNNIKDKEKEISAKEKEIDQNVQQAKQDLANETGIPAASIDTAVSAFQESAANQKAADARNDALDSKYGGNSSSESSSGTSDGGNNSPSNATVTQSHTEISGGQVTDYTSTTTNGAGEVIKTTSNQGTAHPTSGNGSVSTGNNAAVGFGDGVGGVSGIGGASSNNSNFDQFVDDATDILPGNTPTPAPETTPVTKPEAKPTEEPEIVPETLPETVPVETPTPDTDRYNKDDIYRAETDKKTEQIVQNSGNQYEKELDEIRNMENGTYRKKKVDELSDRIKQDQGLELTDQNNTAVHNAIYQMVGENTQTPTPETTPVEKTETTPTGESETLPETVPVETPTPDTDRYNKDDIYRAETDKKTEQIVQNSGDQYKKELDEIRNMENGTYRKKKVDELSDRIKQDQGLELTNQNNTAVHNAIYQMVGE